MWHKEEGRRHFKPSKAAAEYDLDQICTGFFQISGISFGG